jgi:hypothetical protein
MLSMPFGKYKGELIEGIPTSYLKWLLRECKLRLPLRYAVERELAIRRADTAGDDPPAAQAAPAWVNIIRQWHREMALQFHPDRGGHPEAMKAINHAADRLKELTGAAS